LLLLPIKLPSQAIQARKVHILDTIVELITERKQQLEQLDLMVKSQFVEMFGDPVRNEKGWEQVTLREVSRRMSDGPFGSNLKSSHYAESGVRVIRLQNIGVSEFLDSDKAFVPLEHYETLKKYTCKPGDVIIGTLGEPNLRACILPEYVEIAINKADCVHFVTDDGKVNARFVCEYINQPATLVLASGSIHGQTRARISMSQVAALPIYLPPLDLQTRFAAFVRAADKSKFELQRTLDELEATYKALLRERLG
jgi:type I restriction enzyme S subunit